MAASLQPAPDPAGCRVEAHPRAMTRCECAGVSFAEVARLVRERGLTLGQAEHRTGVGRTCSGCAPDLRCFLAARGLL